MAQKPKAIITQQRLQFSGSHATYGSASIWESDGELYFGTSGSSQMKIDRHGTLLFTNSKYHTALDLNNKKIVGVDTLFINDGGNQEGVVFNKGSYDNNTDTFEYKQYITSMQLDQSSQWNAFKFYSSDRPFGFYGSNVGIRTDRNDYSGSAPASLTVGGDVIFGTAGTSGSLGTDVFQSGFGGSGFRIATGSGDLWGITVDDITVRNTMNVYELQISKIRSTNGSLLVAGNGKAETISGSYHPDQTLSTIESGSSIYSQESNYPILDDCWFILGYNGISGSDVTDSKTYNLSPFSGSFTSGSVIHGTGSVHSNDQNSATTMSNTNLPKVTQGPGGSKALSFFGNNTGQYSGSWVRTNAKNFTSTSPKNPQHTIAIWVKPREADITQAMVDDTGNGNAQQASLIHMLTNISQDGSTSEKLVQNLRLNYRNDTASNNNIRVSPMMSFKSHGSGGEASGVQTQLNYYTGSTYRYQTLTPNKWNLVIWSQNYDDSVAGASGHIGKENRVTVLGGEVYNNYFEDTQPNWSYASTSGNYLNTVTSSIAMTGDTADYLMTGSEGTYDVIFIGGPDYTSPYNNTFTNEGIPSNEVGRGAPRGCDVGPVMMWNRVLTLNEMESLYSSSAEFKINTGTTPHSFKIGDLIRTQKFTGTDVVKRDAIVTSVESSTLVNVLPAGYSGSATKFPTDDSEFVRMGSVSDKDRRGSVYLTADDDNAPFIDIKDGVDSHQKFNSSDSAKVRMGRLDGITDSVYGNLDGYGLYSTNVYLKGGITATTGEIGGWTIGNSTITAGNITLDATAEKINIGSNNHIQLSGSGTSKIANFRVDSGYIYRSGEVYIQGTSGEGKIFLGAPSAANSGSAKIYLHGDGSGWLANKNISWDSSGNLSVTSSNADLTLGALELDATNFEISSGEASMSLGEGKIVLQGGSYSNIKIGNSNAIKMESDGTDHYLVFGNKNSFAEFDQSTAGLILGTDNGNSKFEIVGDANNLLSFDGTFNLKTENATISGSSVTIGAQNFDLNSTNLRISDQTVLGAADGKITLSGGNTKLYLGGRITMDGADSGSININDGQVILNGYGTSTISGWTIDSGVIKKSIGSNAISNVYLSTETDNQGNNYQEGLQVYRHNDDVAAGKVKVIRVGGLSDTSNLHAVDDYGIQVIRRNAAGDGFENILYIGESTQTISGWNISTGKLWSSKISLDNANEQILLGNHTYSDAKIALSGSGEGWVADKNIKWNQFGDVDLGTNVTLGYSSNNWKYKSLKTAADGKDFDMIRWPYTFGELPTEYLIAADPVGTPATESAIDYGIDPYGGTSLLFQCRPDSADDSDGGWNSYKFAIDSSSRYMYTCFFKQYYLSVDPNDQYFYWGTHGYNDANNSEWIESTSSVADGNPYFMYGDLPTANKWYLAVGYVHPAGTSDNEGYIAKLIDCETGEEFTDGSKIPGKWFSGGNKWRWRSGAVKTNHRAYHYYNTVAGVTTGSNGDLWQEMYNPMIFQMSGSEGVDYPHPHDLLDRAKLIAYGNYKGGSFISKDVIFAPTIAGNTGKFSGSVIVGHDGSGITIDGTNKKIYQGTGTYGNGNTGFYIDSTGQFSLKDNLTFDGNNLVISGSGTFGGDLVAAGGYFSGSISASEGNIAGWEIYDTYIKKSGIRFGTNQSINNLEELRISKDGSGIGSTDFVRIYHYSGSEGDGSGTGDYGIEGVSGSDQTFHLGRSGSSTHNRIGGWKFDNDKMYTGNDEDTGGYTVGSNLILSSSGAIHSKEFYVNSQGSASFKGEINVGSLPAIPQDEKQFVYYNFDGLSVGSSTILNNHGVNRSNNAVLEGNTGLIVDTNPGQGATSSIDITESHIVSGSAGHGIYLDGKSFIRIPVNNKIDAGVFSISFWFNPAAANYGNGSNQVLLNAYKDNYTDNFSIYHQADTNTISVLVNAGSSTSEYGLNTDKWNHIVYVHSSSDSGNGKHKLYINGTDETGFITTGTAKKTGTKWVSVGAEVDSATNANQAISGGLDEFRMYNKMLSFQEVQGLYANPGGNMGTTISGDNIRTGKISSNNYSYSSGNFSSQGTTIDLDGGEIITPGLRASSSGELFISGSGEFGGSISASSGDIAGWHITSEEIWHNTNGVRTEARSKPGYERFAIYSSSFWLGLGRLYYKSGHKGTGFAYTSDLTNGSHEPEFVIDDDGAGNVISKIAGWDFSNSRFSSSNVVLDSANEQILLGAQNYDDAEIAFSGSGEGKLADGNIAWDKDGNVDIKNASLTIKNDGSGYVPDYFDVANSKFVVLDGSGVHFYGTYEANTTITILNNNREVSKVIYVSPAYTTGRIEASDLDTGYIIESNKPVSIVPIQTDGHPLNLLSKTFFYYTDRYGPSHFKFYSPFVSASVSMSYEEKTYINSDEGVPTTDTHDGTYINLWTSGTVSPDSFLELYGTSSNSFGGKKITQGGSGYSGSKVYWKITSDVPIVGWAAGDGWSGDSVNLTPPSTKILWADDGGAEAVFKNDDGGGFSYTDVEGSAIAASQTWAGNGRLYSMTDGNMNEGFQFQSNGDGSGGDANQGIPISLQGDTYIIPHQVSNFQIIAIQKTNVSVYKLDGAGGRTLVTTLDFGDATQLAPKLYLTGSSDGSGGHVIGSHGMYFEGTGPFALRTNMTQSAGTGDNDEYNVYGYRRSSYSSYNDQVHYPWQDLESTVISGDRITTGKIKSNNWNDDSAGSIIDLNAGTVALGGSGSKASLEFDGTDLRITGSFSSSGDGIFEGTISASDGDIGGWKVSSKRIEKELGTDGTPGKVIISATSSVGSGNTYDEDNQYMKGFSVRTRGSNNSWNLNMGEVLLNEDGTMYTGSSGAGYTPDKWYGINVVKQSNNGHEKELFVIAADGGDDQQTNYQARIAGWSFDDDKFYKGNVILDSSTEKVKLGDLGGKGKILLSGSGAGHLASGNIDWDSTGSLYIGHQTYEHLKITNQGVIQFKDGNDVYGSLDSTTWTLGNTTKVTISSTAINLYEADGTARLTMTSAGDISMADAGGNTRIKINTTQGIIVGNTSQAHQKIDASNTTFYDPGTKERIKISNDGTIALKDRDEVDKVVLNQDGVKIHGTQADDFVHVSDDKVNVVVGGVTQSIFGSSMQIGSTASQHITMDSDNLRFTSGSGAVMVQVQNNGSAYFGATGQKHVRVSPDGVELKDNTTVYGKFASTSYIGSSTGERLQVSSSGLQLFDAGNNSVVSIDSAGVYLSGSISSSVGNIGGWSIVSGVLQSFTANGGIGLSAADNKITINEDVTQRIVLGQVDTNTYGLRGYDSNGSTILFELGEGGNTIAGWSITEEDISSSGITIHSDTTNPYVGIGTTTYGAAGIFLGKESGNVKFSAIGSTGDGIRMNTNGGNLVISSSEFALDTPTIDIVSANGGKVTLGNSTQILLSGSGEGHLAGGNVSWTDAGVVSITGSISLTNGEDFVTSLETGSFVKESDTGSLENPSDYNFGGGGFSLSNNSPSGDGLYLGADYLGFYGSSAWKTYMDNVGNFYLSGSGASFVWDSSLSSLNLSGSKVELKLGADTSTFTNSAIALSGSGEGQLAGGQISWNKEGDLTISSSVTIGEYFEPNFPDNTNLIAYWKLDQEVMGGSGFDQVLDHSGKGYHSYDTGSGVSDLITFVPRFTDDNGVTSPMESFAKFPHLNNEVIHIPSITGSLSNSMDISVSFWMYSLGDQNQCVFCFTNESGHNEFNLFVNHGNNTGRFHLITDHVANGSYDHPDGSVKEKWWHVTITINDDNPAKLYLNGELVNTYTSVDAATDNFGSITRLFIGGDEDNTITEPPTTDQAFNGYLGEFRVYNKELSSGEVKALYTNPESKFGTNIIGDEIRTGYLKSNDWNNNDTGSLIDLYTGNVHLGGSGSESKLYFDGNDLTITGSINATDGFFNGTVSASVGNIGQWVIQSQRIVSPNDRLELDVASTNQVKVAKTSVGSDASDYVRMYYTDDSNWGLQGQSGSVNVFHLGSSNHIAGWQISDTMIEKANKIYLNSATTHGQIWMGSSGYSSAKIGFEGDGSGKLASGKIHWDSSGNTYISASVRIGDGVAGRSGTNVLHYDWSTFEVSSLPDGFSTAANTTASLHSHGFGGGKCLQITSTNGDGWMYFGEDNQDYQMSVKGNTRYLMSTYLSASTANNVNYDFYWFAQSGSELMNHTSDGVSGEVSHQSRGVPADGSWHRISASFKTEPDVVRGRVRIDVDSMNGGEKILWVDNMMIEEIDDDFDWQYHGASNFNGGDLTTISGNQISTGLIRSHNYDAADTGEVFADSGMEINLDSGSITTKQFKVDSSGNATFGGDLSLSSGIYSMPDNAWLIGYWGMNNMQTSASSGENFILDESGNNMTLHLTGSDGQGELDAQPYISYDHNIYNRSGSQYGSLYVSGSDDNLVSGYGFINYRDWNPVFGAPASESGVYNQQYGAGTGSFSVSLWFKDTIDYVDGDNKVLFSCMEAGGFEIDHDHTHINFYLGSMGGAQRVVNMSRGIVTSENGVTPPNFTSYGQARYGEWMHIVAVYDGLEQKMKLYNDGGVVSEDLSAIVTREFLMPAESGLQVRIGNAMISGNDVIENKNTVGYIDDVRLYNKALTDNEVFALKERHLAKINTLRADEIVAGKLKSINWSDTGVTGTKIDLEQGELRAKGGKTWSLTTAPGHFNFSPASIVGNSGNMGGAVIWEDTNTQSPMGGDDGITEPGDGYGGNDDYR